MNILGISSFAHEAACALIVDGVLIAVVEEERLNREKHTWKFPKKAIESCLKIGKLSINDINAYTFFWQPNKELTGNLLHVLKFFPESLNLLRSTSGSEALTFKQRYQLMTNIGHKIRREFGLSYTPKVHFVEHHLAHAASAFFISPFEEAAILTMDGRGEATSTLLAVGKKNKIEKIKEIKVPHSLGHLYAAVTHHLGFKPFFDEWKVMGMSAYGKPDYVKVFEDMVELLPQGEYRLNLKYFKFHTHGQARWVSDDFLKVLGPPRDPKASYTQHHYNIAFGLQKIIEKAGVHLAKYLKQKTGLSNLCMTGGVVLNCLMNKQIVEEAGFKNSFFQPIANDAGTSLGSAYYLYHQILGNERRFVFDSIYLGPEFSDDEICAALKEYNVRYRRSDHIAKDAAQCVANGKILGWFQGRMEAGPRALGNRSIVATALDPNMKDRLNERVKRREGFRPFAPSVLEEKVHEYFMMPKGQVSPYMILIGDVLEEKKKVIPAVTHADGTARVHTVSYRTNPQYWQLIYEFEKLTGVPVVLNTSFNENEPIVCTPKEAIDCFLRTEFDVLAIGDYIVEK
jgi:carbamoyltransferase